MTLTDDQLPTPVGCEHHPDIRCMACYLRDNDPVERIRKARATHAVRQAQTEQWRGAARDAITNLAWQADSFSIDDVWDFLAHRRIAEPPDRRVIGPLLLHLAREQLIEYSGETTRTGSPIYRRKRT